ncbi:MULTISPECIES: aldo/keto reductase family protein [Saccharibacillus]|uniref:aldo/keto reductase family protein n=1 Tax=Saccharibacillus TaxID=456492 RepID=UPI001238C3E7|nr:aldo/keto reductase family protein [Saccharibacillus sp. WB 17]MWJ30930.1 aldo/keto reductase [Saccharibacillus sp. WB 17]
MKYRNLGRTGLKVSEIGLGSWLTYGTAAEQQAADACIEAAFEQGINFFDTANAYNRGEGEKAIGSALGKYERSSYVLSTKVFFPMGDGPNDRGLSRKHIMEQCEASLKRLGTDYIDVYFCHRYDSDTPVDETLRALDDLTAQGKILYAGVSEWTAAQIQSAAGITERRNLRPLASNQPIYNLFERYIEDEVLPVSAEAGLGQVVFSPLAQGILTGKYKPGQKPAAGTRGADDTVNQVIGSYLRDDVLGVTQELNELAGQLGLKLSQLALAWVLRQPGVSSAIIGASRPGQVRENAEASGVVLSEETLAKIDELMQPVRDFAPAR